MIAITEELDGTHCTYTAYVDGELVGTTTSDDIGFSLQVAAHKINFAEKETHNDT